MIQVARRIALVPRASDVDDETAVVLQQATEVDGEGFEPFDVSVGLDVAVVLLPD